MLEHAHNLHNVQMLIQIRQHAIVGQMLVISIQQHRMELRHRHAHHTLVPQKHSDHLANLCHLGIYPLTRFVF